MVAFDNNIFCLALHPSARSDVDRAKDRIEYLLQTLRDQNERVILPTPVLAEFLVFAGNEAPRSTIAVSFHAKYWLRKQHAKGNVWT